MSRVVATFNTNRLSVVATNRVGKMLNSSGVPIYTVVNNTMTAIVILADSRISMTAGGSGTMITPRQAMIEIGRISSRYFRNRLIQWFMESSG